MDTRLAMLRGRSGFFRAPDGVVCVGGCTVVGRAHGREYSSVCSSASCKGCVVKSLFEKINTCFELYRVQL